MYHDLQSNGDLDRLRGSGTAFVPHSVRIERSPLYGHLDAPYIESITFGSKPCRALVPENEFLEEYTDESIQNSSRAQVSFFSDADKPDCALAVPIEARTFYNANEQCNSELLIDNDVVVGLDFEPKCLVVVHALANERALFDEFLRVGRPLDDLLRITVNYTLALNFEPSIPAVATNCHTSRLLQENHERDTVLQAEIQQLEEVRSNITQAAEVIAYTQYVAKELPVTRERFVATNPALIAQLEKNGQGLAFPPPSPPPPVGTPLAPTTDDIIAFFESRLQFLEGQEINLLNAIGECASHNPLNLQEGLICGIPQIEAPDPWTATNGQLCRGSTTKSVRVGDVCGYWDSSCACQDARTHPRNCRIAI